MPVLIDLAPSDALLRNGIRRSRACGVLPAGVYAIPVGHDFSASHRWLRELERSGAPRYFVWATGRLSRPAIT